MSDLHDSPEKADMQALADLPEMRVSPERKKSDILDKGDKMDITVKVLAIGTFISFPGTRFTDYQNGQVFEIVRHRVEIVETSTLVETDLQAVDDEAENLDMPVMTVNLDLWDFKLEY